MVTVNGQKYLSKTAAGLALLRQGFSVSEASKKVGIAYATLYVNSIGKPHRAKLLAKLQAKRLLNSSRNYTQKQVSERTGLGIATVRNVFKTIA